MHFYIHAHRGLPGIFPDNSLEGFVAAVHQGADFLEMDVVLSRDGSLILSHEPWMKATTSFRPDGRVVEKSEESSLVIYSMTRSEASQFTIGLPGSPASEGVRCRKPALEDLVNELPAFKNGGIRFNIELKSSPEGDGIHHPAPDEYASSFLRDADRLGIKHWCVVQSFDTRVLRAIHALDNRWKMVLLDDAARTDGLTSAIDVLGFKPFGYAPRGEAIHKGLADECLQMDVELFAWTINQEDQMESLVRMGVKHIITDYPDRAINLRKRLMESERNKSFVKPGEQ